jgi:hypothetical protein
MLPDASLFRIGMLMIVATGVIQVVAQLVLSHMMDVLPSPPQSRYPRFYMMTHSVTAVVILMIGHILQVMMWALVYHDHWNEFVDLKSALYFSLASEHRMVGALEAAAGMLMFGWSTALLVGVVQRADHRSRP